ncbi:MAG: WecB/TagA/CpsF family glycosyltransferase [Cyanobacteria bacterium SIG32]|nr:WecB/TagA/CpsF family glycosyltransferase [Cyanobacteria bacterium SIG32]
MERAKLLGFNIDKYDFDEAIEVAKSKRGHVVTINPEMIDYASKNINFAEIVHHAELVIPDGIGVQLGLKLVGNNVARIAGVDFAKRMLNETKGSPVAFVGAKAHIIEKAVINLKNEISELNVIYTQDGYFTDTERVLNEVAEKQPELLLVALGSPKQEEFIYKLKTRLPNTIMIGVGGSFDVWSGEVERAPEIYQKLGLEWLYRTIKEPKRFKRIFPTLPMFVLKVLRYGVNDVNR